MATANEYAPGELDAIRLARTASRGRAAVARDRQLAQDDAVFNGLKKAGAELVTAIDGVRAEAGLWERLEQAARGSTPLPLAEREALEALLEGQLPALVDALEYTPPPEIVEFLDELLNAVAGALDSDLSPEARAEQIAELRFQLGTFTFRLRALLDDEHTQPPRARRRRLRQMVIQGSDATAALAVAAASIGAEAGFTALGVPGFGSKLGGKAAELLAAAVTKKLHDALAEPDAETLEAFRRIDPDARVKAFARLLEGRLAQAISFDYGIEELLERTEGDFARLERAIERADRAAALEGPMSSARRHLQAARKTRDRDALLRALRSVQALRKDEADVTGLTATELTATEMKADDPVTADREKLRSAVARRPKPKPAADAI